MPSNGFNWQNEVYSPLPPFEGEVLPTDEEKQQRFWLFLGNVALEIDDEDIYPYRRINQLSYKELEDDMQDLLALIMTSQQSQETGRASIPMLQTLMTYYAEGLDVRHIAAHDDRFPLNQNSRRKNALFRFIKHEYKPQPLSVRGWDFTTPLLEDDQEVELAIAIEAGIFAGRILQQYANGKDPLPTGAFAVTNKRSLQRESDVEQKNKDMPKIVENYINDKLVTIGELETIETLGKQAMELCVSANLRFVRYELRKHRKVIEAGGIAHIGELMPEAVFGLLEGLMHYDYTRGVKLMSYCSHWIDKAIKDGIVARQPLLVSRQQYWRMIAVRQIKSAGDINRRLSDEEIADTYNLAHKQKLSPSAVKDLEILSMKLHGAISLHALLHKNSNRDGRRIVDTDFSVSPSAEELFIAKEKLQAVYGALGKLPPKHRAVVAASFGLHGLVASDDDIQIVYGINKEALESLRQEAYGMLRSELDSYRHE